MSDTLARNEGIFVGSGDHVARLDRVGPIGLLLAIVGAIVLIIAGAAGHPVEVAGSWMFAWYFWLTVTMGMFGLTILHHTIRPSWSLPLLRLFESGGGPVSLAVMALLFVPILYHPQWIYDWSDPIKVQADAVLRFKQPYLNLPFWLGRFAFFFIVWISLSGFLRGSARKQEQNGEFGLEKGRSSWGAVGIVIFLLTYSFGVIDWVMSLEPHWYSTMLPLWQTIASCLGAAAFSVAMACVNAKRDPYPSVFSPNLTKDWGNILFMFTMLWAYTAISQFLIIWNGNLPDTAQYYARRSYMMWNAIGMITIVGQFLVPWMSLLSPRVKRYPRLLRKIAGWIFVIHIVDVYFAVGPGLPTGVAGQHRSAFSGLLVYDVIAWLTIGGVWLFVFGSQVKTAPLLVTYDNRLQEALVHAH